MHQPLQRHQLRQQFMTASVETASPAKVVTMSFDRLDRDLAAASDAIERKDPAAAHAALTHAQDLLGELAGMLDVDGWRHAGSLLAVYDYILRLIARANFSKDARLVAEASRLIGELGEAFRSAAVPATTDSGAASPALDSSATAGTAPAGSAATQPVAPLAPISAFSSSAVSAESTLVPTSRLSVRA